MKNEMNSESTLFVGGFGEGQETTTSDVFAALMEDFVDEMSEVPVETLGAMQVTISVSDPGEVQAPNDLAGKFIFLSNCYTIGEVLEQLMSNQTLFALFRSNWTNDLSFESDLEFGKYFYQQLAMYDIEEFDDKQAMLDMIAKIEPLMEYVLATPNCSQFLLKDEYVMTNSILEAGRFTWEEANELAERDDSLAIYRKTLGGCLQVKPGQFTGFMTNP